MKKLVFQWLPMALVSSALACVAVCSGCSTAPPPVPEVEEEQTEEYIQGEQSYQQQQN